MEGKIEAVGGPQVLGYSAVAWRRLGSELVWVICGQAVAALGSISLVKLLTTRLPPASYGEFALGLTVATLFQQTIFGPLASSALRFFSPSLEAGRFAPYTKALKRLLIRSALIVAFSAAVLAVGVVFGLEGGHVSVAMCLMAALFALLSGWGSVLDAEQSAARRRAIVAWHQGLGQWTRAVTAFAFVVYGATAGSMAMLGYALGALPVIVSQVFQLRRQRMPLMERQALFNEKDVEAEVHRLRRYATPIGLWGIFTWAQAASDRWALSWFASAGEVGLYQTLYQTGYAPLTLLTNVGVQLASPILFAMAGDGLEAGRMNRMRQLNLKLTIGVLILTAVATLVAAQTHRWVYRLLTAPEYWTVSSFLPWMVLSAGLFAAGQVAALSIAGGHSNEPLLLPKIATALIGTGLNIVGGRLFGLAGVIAAGVFFSLIFLIWISAKNYGRNTSQPYAV